MTIEASFNYPSDLNASYPAAGDGKTEGDDHIRGVKNVFKTTFPNVSGAITPTHTVLNYMLGVTSAVQTQLDNEAAARIANDALKANLAGGATFTGTIVLPATTSIGTVSATEIGYVDGVTSAIQTQLDAKAPLASPALTGTPTAPTATAGDSSTKIATTAFVAATGLSSALPGQLGNSGKVVTTDGTNASWALVTTLGAEPTQTAASQAEMEAGVSTSLRSMTPQRVAQAITAQVPALVPVATQAEQETATSITKFVSPGRQQYHPSAAKAWIKCDSAGAIQASYNITSITDVGTGVVDVTIATDFSSADYAITSGVANGATVAVMLSAQAAGSFRATTLTPASAGADPTNYFFACFGDQA